MNSCMYNAQGSFVCHGDNAQQSRFVPQQYGSCVERFGNYDMQENFIVKHDGKTCPHSARINSCFNAWSAAAPAAKATIGTNSACANIAGACAPATCASLAGCRNNDFKRDSKA